MNTTLKYAIGASIGAGLGWFVGRVIVEYIYLKEHPFEYDEASELNPGNETEKDMTYDPAKFEPKDFKKKDKAKSPPKKNYDQLFGDKPDILQLAKKYSGEEVAVVVPTTKLTDNDILGIQEQNELFEEIRDDILKSASKITDDESTDPSIITMEEFANAEDYERTTLHYYQDDILVDSDDKPIDRPERFLGDEALVSFDDGVVYVKNEKKKAMYEIVQLDQNYAVTTTRRKVPMSRPQGKKGIDYNVEEETVN